MNPRINVYNIVSRIECEPALLNKLNNLLAVEYPGAEYIRRRNPNFSGYWFPLNARTQTFPTGLIERVKELVPNIEVVDKRERPKVLEYNPKILNIALAEHQEKAVKIALEKGRGILNLPTGSGKTEASIAIAMHIEGKAAVMVHRKDLLYQFAERIKLRLGKGLSALFGDGRWDEIDDKKFIIFMPQTVEKDLLLFKTYLSDVNTLILDEVHRTATGKIFYKIAQSIPSYFRLGLSGSIELNDPVRETRLIAVTGPVIYKLGTKELQDIGWVCKAKVIYHKIHNKPLPLGTEYHDAYRILIEENPDRNAEIVKIAIDAAEKGEPCLIIADKLRHVRILTELLRGQNIRCRSLTGINDSWIRNKTKKDFAVGAIQCIIASTVYDEGIDLPALKCIILSAGGKSPVRLIQRIGRALRTHPSKELATIHDFYDAGGSRYVTKHSISRIQTCLKEQFEVEGVDPTLIKLYSVKEPNK